MISAISKIPASSESAVHAGRRRRRRNDFLAVVLSWPADAIQPRSLITRTQTGAAHTHTHTHTRVQWNQCGRWNAFLQVPKKCLSIQTEQKLTFFQRTASACDTYLRYVNASGACRTLQALCAAHRWLQCTFVHAHHVNKATRQALQMLHKERSTVGSEDKSILSALSQP